MDVEDLSPAARDALRQMGQHRRKKFYYSKKPTPEKQPRRGLWFGPEVTDELRPLLTARGGSQFTLNEQGRELAKGLGAGPQ